MSNSTNNKLSITMTAAQVTAVKTALGTINTNMPFLLGLTLDERSSIPKINVNNKTFTEDAINAAVNNSAMLPSFLNTAGMQSDFTLYTQIDELRGMVAQALERLEDTQMLAGSEAYISALTSYRLFGAAAAAGISGSDTVYQQLAERFASSGSATTTTP